MSNDKSELIDEVLDNFRHGVVVEATGLMIRGGTKEQAVEISRKYQKEAKATLQKAFREVEIEGRIDELENIVVDINYSKTAHQIDERLAELTKIKEDK